MRRSVHTLFLVEAITIILSVLGSIQAFTTPTATRNGRHGRLCSDRGQRVQDFPSYGGRALYGENAKRGEKPFFGDSVVVLDDSAELVDCLVRSKFSS
jgi:hypothetical protein